MKKEVVLAIVIGFALGLVITFGIWTASRSLRNSGIAAQPTPATNDVIPQTTDDSDQPILLEISSPADESLVNTSKVLIVGKTAANAVVVVMDENTQAIVSADTAGNFTADVNLIGGYNLIRIVAYDEFGNSREQSLIITYSTQV